MSAEHLINALMDIHPKGFDLSLERINGLLEKLGNPHRKLPPVIHVAGTNGKGSTIAFCRAILEAAGKSVHVDTSPHLVNWHERFRLGSPTGGKLVEDSVLEDAIARVAEANDGQAITVFEILSAVAFVLFSEHPADYCLIEVGLGGRFDCTNVIDAPEVCVITPIALDHQAYLGDTIAKIAFEKAGIIKKGARVVIGPQPADALDVIEKKAADCGCPVTVANQDFDFFEQGGRFIFQDLTGLLDLPLPKLMGGHQLTNAATAIAAIRSLELDLPNEVFEEAMTRVYWPGRMQHLTSGTIPDLFPDGSDILVDGGHNPAAGLVVADALTERNRSHPLDTFMICGMLTTKEPGGYFDAISAVVDRVLTVPVQSSDAGFDPKLLAEFAEKSGLQTEHFSSLGSAVEALCRTVKEKPARIIFAGSLYLAGDVLRMNGTPPH